MNIRETFSKRIYELRLAKGTEYTRQKVANELGISRASLEYYEKGQRMPDIEVAAKIAEYYNVSTDYLLGRTQVASLSTDVQAISDYTNLSESAINTLHSDFKELNTQLIASIAFKDKDAESNSFYNYFYFYHENLGKCISTLLDHKEGVDLLIFIQHYIVLKTTDTKINCDFILSALHLEILERLKQMRDKQNRPLNIDLDKLFDDI